MFLREYDRDVRYVKGVGPNIAKLLGKLDIVTVPDLILHFPRDYVDRKKTDLISDSLKKGNVNLLVRVIAQDSIGYGRKKTLKVYIEDDSGRASLVCFGRNFLAKVLIPERLFRVYGSFTYRYGEIQSTNFEIEPFSEHSENFERIVPIYPLTEGLNQRLMRRIVANAFNLLDSRIDEEIPAYLREKYLFPPREEALRRIHFPEDFDSLEISRKLLAYEELFYLELFMLRKKKKRKAVRRKRSAVSHRLKNALIRRLPFRLTDDQVKVLEEIEKDLFDTKPMMRMLQGDVGCGKTLVAFLSALSVIESGEQVALMAPTELLARQHAENAARLLEPIGIRLGLLVGGMSERERLYIGEALRTGEVDMVIGTHALFSSDVKYRKLGLIVIDEQHRFGVLQRIALAEKGKNPDLLLMTATPIPRSLSLTFFGDLDISTIRTMPEGRTPVITHLAREGNEAKVYDRVRAELNRGHQAYFVYPLIEESESLDLKNAQNMFEYLSKEVFKDWKLTLIHSRVPQEEKKRRMDDFVNGKCQILVATSVVEVGVDVPNATCMVIEHAERFGLSALHQLRGRVGRSSFRSYCFLIYGKNLTESGIRRLRVMKETTDGFQIAEEDLKIRGPGELLGIRQSGPLRFKVADLTSDTVLIENARRDVEEIIEKDPGLLSPRNLTVRKVLERVPPYDDSLLAGG